MGKIKLMINNTERLYLSILDSLENEKPFCHTRLGDGEGIFLSNEQSNHRSKYVQRKQLGRLLSDDEYKEYKEKLINSLKNSDYLGIPINMGNSWKHTTKFLYDIKIHEYDINLCNMQSHRNLLHDGYLDKLFNKVDNLVIVNGRKDIVNKIHGKYNNIKNIEYHEIPPQQHHPGETEKVDNYNLKIFDSICNEFGKQDRKGELLLYGCGVFGKYIGYHFAKAGGVSVDIGSVFDVLVGMKTRGYINTDYLNKYSL